MVTVLAEALPHHWSCHAGIVPNVSEKGTIDGLSWRSVQASAIVNEEFSFEDAVEARPARAFQNNGRLCSSDAYRQGVLIGAVHDPLAAFHQLSDSFEPLRLGCRPPSGLPKVSIEVNGFDFQNSRQLQRESCFSRSAGSKDEDLASRLQTSEEIVHVDSPRGRT